MSSYNTSWIEVACPRCGETRGHAVNIYCGETSDMLSVNVGDNYPSEDVDTGEGYAECESCRRDFFCVVTVKDRVLASIVPDLQRTAYVPDSKALGKCPQCGRDMSVHLFRYVHRANAHCTNAECGLTLIDVAIREIGAIANVDITEP